MRIRCNICSAILEANTPEELARARKVHNKLFHVGKDEDAKKLTASGVCPECGSTLFSEGGCLSCRGCGFSRCS